MCNNEFLLRTVAIAHVPLILLAGGALRAQPTLFQPSDLFRIQHTDAIAWSPDGRHAAIEFTKPGESIDPAIPAKYIAILDAQTRTLRRVADGFNPVWSPDSKQFAFLSVDRDANVRVWRVSTAPRDSTPVLVPALDARTGLGEHPLVWTGNDRLAVVAWEPGAEKRDELHFHVLRGRGHDSLPNSAAFESGKPQLVAAPASRLVNIDFRTGARVTIARGGIHRLELSGDGGSLRYLSEEPRVVASYFDAATDPGSIYNPVVWGSAQHEVRLSPPAPAPTRPADHLLLRETNDVEGSHLRLGDVEVWRGNAWIRDITVGKSEPISYTSTEGKPLTGWLLLPPDYRPGAKVPLVTIIYPGTMYSVRDPFSSLNANFLHPQLFAALGYAVLLPSMPEPLASGVMPAIDAVIARGVADPERVAVVGTSAGGYSVLRFLTESRRFRSAIASASYCDLTSLYGSFYGQFRYGDAGSPVAAQILRMLQMERGFMNLGTPPWADPERYRERSPLLRAAEVTTPLMLVHGDLDYIPVQQAEEFYTALYRQDKRAILVRYQREWHGIVLRENVLDLWKRIFVWLHETLA
jgi:dipeptidyl aminopeptidase/acylaminoacyl peptidase